MEGGGKRFDLPTRGAAQAEPDPLEGFPLEGGGKRKRVSVTSVAGRGCHPTRKPPSSQGAVANSSCPWSHRSPAGSAIKSGFLGPPNLRAPQGVAIKRDSCPWPQVPPSTPETGAPKAATLGAGGTGSCPREALGEQSSSSLSLSGRRGGESPGSCPWFTVPPGRSQWS